MKRYSIFGSAEGGMMLAGSAIAGCFGFRSGFLKKGLVFKKLHHFRNRIPDQRKRSLYVRVRAG
jgi:hypothetical protein